MDRQVLGVTLRTDGGVSGLSTAAEPRCCEVSEEEAADDPPAPVISGASRLPEPRLSRHE